MLSIFSCICWPSIAPFLRKCFFRSSVHFWFFFFYWVVFIFWQGILIPCQCFFCKYFLLLWGLSFSLIYGLFCSAKLLSFIRPHFFTFVVFMFITLGGGSKKILRDLCQRLLCLCFTLRVFLEEVLFVKWCSILYLSL